MNIMNANITYHVMKDVHIMYDHTSGQTFRGTSFHDVSRQVQAYYQEKKQCHRQNLKSKSKLH